MDGRALWGRGCRRARPRRAHRRAGGAASLRHRQGVGGTTRRPIGRVARRAEPVPGLVQPGSAHVHAGDDVRAGRDCMACCRLRMANGRCAESAPTVLFAICYMLFAVFGFTAALYTYLFSAFLLPVAGAWVLLGWWRWRKEPGSGGVWAWASRPCRGGALVPAAGSLRVAGQRRRVCARPDLRRHGPGALAHVAGLHGRLAALAGQR